MLNKKLMILTIFLVSLLAVSAVNATDNATGDVVNMDEKIDEVVSIYDENQISETNDSNEKTFADLQEDINMAEENSTITLENDYAFKSGDVIKINKSLLINGKGHTLDGKNSKGFLNVESSNLILKNITFINAFSKDSGAINIKSSNVVIIDCYFRSNHGHKDYNRGGAIYTESSNLICINCCFDSNYLYSYGSGAAINSKYCTLNLSNCYFVNNSAGDEGGAIYSFDCDIFINNCVFVNNSANYYGGAVYKNYYERNVTISNSNFVNNFARKDGGAIYGGEFNVNNCNFTDNSVNGDGGAINSWDDKISNSRFINNSANGNGGAVCSYGDMSNCYFENNHASDYGAIYSFGQRVTLINSTLINNSPDNMDKLYTSVFMKDIFLLNEELTVYIKDNIGIVDDCTGNMTFNYDGDEQTLKLVKGVCKIPLKNLPVGRYTFEIKYNGDEKYRSSENTTVEIEVIEGIYSSFKDLQYLIDNLEGDTLNLNSDYIHGLSKDDCTIRIDKPIKINGNGHSIMGGDYSYDYDNDRAMIRINSSSTVFNNLNLINAYPHAIAFYGNFEANNCSFINNTGGIGGGCAICSYGNVVIRNSKFIDNIMEFTIGNGGAIFSSGNVSIYNSLFNNNHAQYDGGAIYSESNINIYDSIFFNCNSEKSGGAIYSKGNVTLHNTSFFDCDAEDYGGIIYSESHVIIKDSEFEHGVAKDGGGAIYARKSINISGTTFNSINCVDFLFFGGAIVCEDDVNIYNSSINGSKRGAIYSKKHVNVFDSSFTNNYDGENGGAIYAQNGTHIFNSNFTSNSVGSDGIGGAIYALADVFIEKSIFNGNSANDIGGAIYSKYGVKVNNSYFSDNHASDSGGAIFASNVSTENTTFFNNSVRVYVTGGAIYAKNSIDVINSIFKSNIGRPVFCENNMSVIGSLFENNSYGVIQCKHVDVLDSIFNNNTSLNDGACIYSSTVNAYNSDFINNFCQYNAGAIYSTGTVKVGDCNFINNTCKSDCGGAIYSNGNRIIMNNTSFVNNTPYFRDRLKITISIEGFSDEINVIQDVYDFKINFEDNEGLIRELNKPVDVYYNGTYNFTINMNNGSFNLNNLKVGKYSLFMKGDNNYSSCNRSFFIVDLTYHSFTELQNLIDNVAEFKAIDLEYNYVYGLDVNDTILNINKPITINGYNHIVNGADRMNIFKVNVDDVTLNITGDEALTISEINVEINFNDLILCYGNTTLLSEGSAIHIISGNMNIVNCEFNSNIESPYNPVICSEQDFNIVNSSFIDNAMIIHSIKNLTIINSKFENNHFFTESEVSYYGGHLNCINIYSTGNLSVYNSSFTNNVQVIYSTGNLSVYNSYFDNNVAEGGGSSIFSEGNAQIHNSIFVNNRATSFKYWILFSFAIFESDGGVINSLGTLHIHNSSFINNSALKNGGAIYSWGNITVSNSSFINNEAKGFGGSIYTYGNCTIAASNFENNFAKNGSAIYIVIPTEDNRYSIVVPKKSYPVQYVGSIDKNWLKEQYESKANNTFITIYDSKFLNNYGCEISYLENAYNTLYVSDYDEVLDCCDVKFSGANGVVAEVIGYGEARIHIINNSKISLSNLDSGNYTLNVKTVPDETHYPTEANITISVSNKTYPSLFLTDNITFYYNGEGSCNVQIGGDTSVVAEVIGYGEAKIDIINNSRITVSNLVPGNYTLNVKTIPTANYYSTEANVSIIVNKAYPTISISKKNDTAGLLAIIYNKNPIESADISYTIGNNTKNVTLESSYLVVKNLEGNVSIKVKFKGNEYYNPCEKSTTLTFKNRLNPMISITKWNETTGKIRVTYDGQSIKSAKITYTIGKITNTRTISEPLLVTGLSGDVKIKVVFEGTDEYNYCENSTILSFKGTESGVMPEIDDSQLDEPFSGGVIHITLPSDATGTITLIIDDNNFVFDVVAGKVNVELPDLGKGNYPYTLEYSGDGKYLPYFKAGELFIKDDSVGTVIVMESTFSRYANDYYAGERGELFYATLYDVNGIPLVDKTVQITVNGVIYDVVTDNGGKAGLAVNLAAANSYTYALLFGGDEEYKASLMASSKLTVVKKPTTIIANNMAFKTNAKTKTVSVALNTIKNPYDGKLYLKKGKTLTLSVNGKTYCAKTDQKGIVKFNIKLAKKGKYIAIIRFNGDNTYASTSKKIIISISNSPTKNKALTGVGVGMTPSNVDAVGSLNIIGDYSDYLVEENVSTSDNDQSKKDVEIVVDQKFTRVANDYYAGERGDFFYATLKETGGKPLAGKTVQIAVNGPIYKGVTDNEGKVGLQVNLAAANTYTYALSFSGDAVYNPAELASSKLTVTKKPTSISASNVKFKLAAKTKTISVTLKTSKNPYDGKTYLKSGKQLTLKVNGKTYTAKTNGNSVAKFSIKLTKKGTFTGSISFGGDNTYDGCSKSVKITIK